MYYIVKEDKIIKAQIKTKEEAEKWLKNEEFDTAWYDISILNEEQLYNWLYNEKKFNKKISFRVNNSTYKKLQKIAKDSNIKIGQVVRSAILKFCEEYEEFEKEIFK